jgi:hypothetical protein
MNTRDPSNTVTKGTRVGQYRVWLTHCCPHHPSPRLPPTPSQLFLHQLRQQCLKRVALGLHRLAHALRLCGSDEKDGLKSSTTSQAHSFASEGSSTACDYMAYVSTEEAVPPRQPGHAKHSFAHRASPCGSQEAREPAAGPGPSQASRSLTCRRRVAASWVC